MASEIKLDQVCDGCGKGKNAQGQLDPSAMGDERRAIMGMNQVYGLCRQCFPLAQNGVDQAVKALAGGGQLVCQPVSQLAGEIDARGVAKA